MPASAYGNESWTIKENCLENTDKRRISFQRKTVEHAISDREVN
jgi:hypothetical protein